MALRDSKLAPRLCNVLGTLIVLIVFVLFIPITAPRLAGYEVYEVLSGSMEPEIPKGSVIYVHAVEPSEVEVDDIIAFHSSDSIVAHRVLINRTTLGEFVTKGDANNAEDREPVPYDALIGEVKMHLPLLGRAMALYSNGVGKIYLLLTFACGVMLNLLAERLREQQGRRAREALRRTSGEGASDTSGADAAARRRGHLVRQILMAACAAVFICSAGAIAYILHGYEKVDQMYVETANQYTTKDAASPVPIEVDFDALRAENPDVIGWIYCADTVIDYPILHGADNDEYLHRDYHGKYDFAGSIFIESTNKPDFSDAKTIIYGHHLYTELMFSCLEKWESQSFYEEHPVMWLLTPERDYQVVLVSGHHTSAYSDFYDIIPEHGERMNGYLQAALDESDFTPLEEVTANPANNYVMLSTCAYVFDNARYVLHGMLIPTNTAGGRPL